MTLPWALWLVLAAQPDPAFVEALKLHQAGKLPEAVERYRAALKAQPRSLEARSNLGAALAALGRYDDAIAEYRKGLEIEPRNTALRVNLALAYYKSDRLRDALRELTEAREGNADDLKLALLVADCHFKLGENSKVVEVLESLGRRDPGEAAIDYLLGTALIREGRVAEGQALADRILRRGDVPEAHLMLGSAAMRTARFQEAAREFARALELNPKLPTAHLLLGQARSELGDREGAAQAYRHELAIDPNSYEAHLQLGILLKEDRGPREGLPHLARAAALRPEWLVAPFHIAAARLILGELEPARILLERLVKQAPGWAEAHANLATVYLRLGRKQDAVRERDLAAALASRER